MKGVLHARFKNKLGLIVVINPATLVQEIPQLPEDLIRKGNDIIALVHNKPLAMVRIDLSQRKQGGLLYKPVRI
jgi:adenylosuccinate synthase